MKVLFILFLTVAFTCYSEKPPTYSIDKETILKIEKHYQSKAKTASLLASLVLDKEPSCLIEMLGATKFAIRQFAINTLKKMPGIKHELKQRAAIEKDLEVILNIKEILKNQKTAKSTIKDVEPILEYLNNVTDEYHGKNQMLNKHLMFFLDERRIKVFLQNYKLNDHHIIEILFNSSLPSSLGEPLFNDSDKLTKQECKDLLLKDFDDYDPFGDDPFGSPTKKEIRFKTPDAPNHLAPSVIEYLNTCLKQNSPELYRLSRIRFKAIYSNLNCGRIIDKLMLKDCDSVGKIKQIAEEVSQRQDFKENKNLYIWKFLIVGNLRTKALALHLMGKNPAPYEDKIFFDLNNFNYDFNVLDYTLFYKSLLSLNSSDLNYKVIESLLRSSSKKLVSLGVNSINEDSIEHLENLRTEFNPAAMDLYKKISRKFSSNDRVRESFLLTKPCKKIAPHKLLKLAQIFESRNLKADKEINRFLEKNIHWDSPFLQNYLNIIYNIDGDGETALSIIRRTNQPWQGAKLIWTLNKVKDKSKVKNFLLNEYVFNHTELIDTLKIYPGALENSVQRKLETYKDLWTESKGSFFSCWDMNDILLELHKREKLLPIIRKFLKHRDFNVQVLANYYLALTKQTVEANFFAQLQKEKLHFTGLKDALAIIAMKERPAMEFIALHKKFITRMPHNGLRYYMNYPSQFNLSYKNKEYIPEFIKIISGEVNSDHPGQDSFKTLSKKRKMQRKDSLKIHYCHAILCIDPNNKYAADTLTKMALGESIHSAVAAFRILFRIGKEPVLKIEAIKRFLRTDQYLISLFAKSLKNASVIIEYKNKNNINFLFNSSENEYFPQKINKIKAADFISSIIDQKSIRKFRDLHRYPADSIPPESLKKLMLLTTYKLEEYKHRLKVFNKLYDEAEKQGASNNLDPFSSHSDDPFNEEDEFVKFPPTDEIMFQLLENIHSFNELVGIASKMGTRASNCWEIIKARLEKNEDEKELLYIAGANIPEDLAVRENYLRKFIKVTEDSKGVISYNLFRFKQIIGHDEIILAYYRKVSYQKNYNRYDYLIHYADRRFDDELLRIIEKKINQRRFIYAFLELYEKYPAKLKHLEGKFLFNLQFLGRSEASQFKFLLFKNKAL